MADILKVEGLNVTFGDHHVLQDVSFALDAGDSLVVIGPNGAGKTVLLKSLLGLEPYTGTVTWAKDARIGYVPQKIEADRHLPINLQNLLDAKANILDISEAKVKTVAQEIGLTAQTLKTPVGHLSGGNFQKALIAFALLGEPNVILFDEPTASLDELSEAHIYDVAASLREKHGITMIFVSHDLSIVPSIATKVLCLNKYAVCFGTPKETLTQDVFTKLYPEPHKFFHHLSAHHDHAHHDHG